MGRCRRRRIQKVVSRPQDPSGWQIALTWVAIIVVGWLLDSWFGDDGVAPPTVAERSTIRQTAETTGTATFFATAKK